MPDQEPPLPPMEDLSHAVTVLDELARRAPHLDREAWEASWCLRGLFHRHAQSEAPLVIAVVGPSGVGKSTLVSSLAGARVGDPGVLRPSTLAPAVWGDNAAAKDLAGVLQRTARLASRPTVTAEGALERVLVVDTPPSDSAGSERDVCRVAVACSDLAITVTNCVRYADVVTLEIAEAVRMQGAPQLFVINQLPTDRDQRDQLVADYTEHLIKAGILEPDGNVIGVAEGSPDPFTGALEQTVISPLRGGVDSVVLERQAALAGERILGAFAWTADHLDGVASAYRSHIERDSQLANMVGAAYGREAESVASAVRRGGFAKYSADWKAASAAIVEAVVYAAGAAARTVADLWRGYEEGTEILNRLAGSAQQPDPVTPQAAREGIEDWRRNTDHHAGEAVRPRILRPFLGTTVREYAWRGSLDTDAPVPASLRRFTKPAVENVVVQGRRALERTVTATVLDDGDRFIGLLPEVQQLDVTPLDELARLLSQGGTTSQNEALILSDVTAASAEVVAESASDGIAVGEGSRTRGG